MKVIANFDDLAKKLIFTSNSMAEIEAMGYQPRKGVTFETVRRAIKQGMKDGLGRTELEIDMVAFRLSQVFKRHLALTPYVVKTQALHLKNRAKYMTRDGNRDTETYKALLRDARKLAQMIPASVESGDQMTAMLALDIIATRENTQFAYKEA